MSNDYNRDDSSIVSSAQDERDDCSMQSSSSSMTSSTQVPPKRGNVYLVPVTQSTIPLVSTSPSVVSASPSSSLTVARSRTRVTSSNAHRSQHTHGVSSRISSRASAGCSNDDLADVDGAQAHQYVRADLPDKPVDPLAVLRQDAEEIDAVEFDVSTRNRAGLGTPTSQQVEGEGMLNKESAILFNEIADPALRSMRLADYENKINQQLIDRADLRRRQFLERVQTINDILIQVTFHSLDDKPIVMVQQMLEYAKEKWLPMGDMALPNQRSEWLFAVFGVDPTDMLSEETVEQVRVRRNREYSIIGNIATTLLLKLLKESALASFTDGNAQSEHAPTIDLYNEKCIEYQHKALSVVGDADAIIRTISLAGDAILALCQCSGVVSSTFTCQTDKTPFIDVPREFIGLIGGDDQEASAADGNRGNNGENSSRGGSGNGRGAQKTNVWSVGGGGGGGAGRESRTNMAIKNLLQKVFRESRRYYDGFVYRRKTPKKVTSLNVHTGETVGQKLVYTGVWVKDRPIEEYLSAVVDGMDQYFIESMDTRVWKKVHDWIDRVPENPYLPRLIMTTTLFAYKNGLLFLGGYDRLGGRFQPPVFYEWCEPGIERFAPLAVCRDFDINFDKTWLTCPWEEIPTPNIDQILKDQHFDLATRKFMLALLGRMLFPRHSADSWHIVLAALGVAGAGKSSVIESLIKLLQDDLVYAFGDDMQREFGLSHLATSAVWVIHELTEQMATTIPPGQLLALISNDTVQSFPRKNQTPWRGRVRAHGVISGNGWPRAWSREPTMMFAWGRRFMPFLFQETPQTVNSDLAASISRDDLPACPIKYARAYCDLIESSWQYRIDPQTKLPLDGADGRPVSRKQRDIWDLAPAAVLDMRNSIFYVGNPIHRFLGSSWVDTWKKLKEEFFTSKRREQADLTDDELEAAFTQQFGTESAKTYTPIKWTDFMEKLDVYCRAVFKSRPPAGIQPQTIKQLFNMFGVVYRKTNGPDETLGISEGGEWLLNLRWTTEALCQTLPSATTNSSSSSITHVGNSSDNALGSMRQINAVNTSMPPPPPMTPMSRQGRSSNGTGGGLSSIARRRTRSTTEDET